MYVRSVCHVLNEISNTSWYSQPAKIRYNTLGIKHQQTKNCGNRTSHKNYRAYATLYYSFTIMAKPNEIDKWSVELEPEPKQFWMVAAGTEANSFTRWNLKFRFRLLSLGGKRVNLLRVERGLSCVYIITSFPWLFEGGAWGPWTRPPNFEIWKYFFLSFEFVNEKYNCCFPPWKMLLPSPVKTHYCPPSNKSFLRPRSSVCRPGVLKLICTCSAIHQI